MSDSYELIRVLRQLGLPDRHIRLSLRAELGLDDDGIDRALGSSPADRSSEAEQTVIDLTDSAAEVIQHTD